MSAEVAGGKSARGLPPCQQQEFGEGVVVGESRSWCSTSPSHMVCVLVGNKLLDLFQAFGDAALCDCRPLGRWDPGLAVVGCCSQGGLPVREGLAGVLVPPGVSAAFRFPQDEAGQGRTGSFRVGHCSLLRN